MTTSTIVLHAVKSKQFLFLVHYCCTWMQTTWNQLCSRFHSVKCNNNIVRQNPVIHNVRHLAISDLKDLSVEIIFYLSGTTLFFRLRAPGSTIVTPKRRCQHITNCRDEKCSVKCSQRHAKQCVTWNRHRMLHRWKKIRLNCQKSGINNHLPVIKKETRGNDTKTKSTAKCIVLSEL